METLYLVEYENERGCYDEPYIVNNFDDLYELAKQCDEEIPYDENVILDALVGAFGYTITEINSIDDIYYMFDELKARYFNY